jgi:hypothetical protein
MGERGGREEKGAQKKMRHMQKGEYNKINHGAIRLLEILTVFLKGFSLSD